MNKKNKLTKINGVLAGVAFAALTAVSAQAQTAEALVSEFETVIDGNSGVMWTLGAVVAGFVAVVAVIGLIIRGAKRLSSSS